MKPVKLLLIFFLLTLACIDNPTSSNKEVDVSFTHLLEGYYFIPQFFYYESANLLLITSQKEVTDDFTSVRILDGTTFQELAFFENASVPFSSSNYSTPHLTASKDYLLVYIDRVLHKINLKDFTPTQINNIGNKSRPSVLLGKFGIGTEFKQELSRVIYTVFDFESEVWVDQKNTFERIPDLDYSFSISDENLVFSHSLREGIDIIELNESTGEIIEKTRIDFSYFDIFHNFVVNTENNLLFNYSGKIYSLQNNGAPDFEFVGQFDAILNNDFRFEPSFVLPSDNSDELFFFGSTDSLSFDVPSVSFIKVGYRVNINKALPFVELDNYPKSSNRNVLPVLGYKSDSYINIIYSYRQEGNSNLRNYFVEQYDYEDFYDYLIQE